MQDDHTPPPHSFFPEAIPGLSPTLPYLPSAPYQTEPLQPVFTHAVPPAVTMDGQIPIPVPYPSSPATNAVVHSPRPQLTPKHSFTRDPVLGSLTISKSERVEELEKMADEVAERNRDLSGDLPKAANVADGDHLNLNKTLPGPPVPSGKFRGRKRMGWDNDVIINNRKAEEEPQQSRDLMSVFPADYQAVQSQEQPPSVSGFTYQTPPTPTLMAVLGPPKQTVASESGLDALERRLLAEVGTRKHLEPWDNNTHHNYIIAEEDEENVENGRTRCRVKTKDHQLGRRDVRDVLLLSPAVAGATGNSNQRLPPIDTDLDLDLVRREEVNSGDSGGGNGISAPIAIPMKSPDPLNESCISSLTLGGEGLVGGLPGTGPGNGGGTAPAAGDSDGEEAEFDGRTHRAGSASTSGGSNSSSDRMVPGARGGGFHKHMRQRVEVSTPTEMIPQQRVRSRRGGSGRGSGGGGRAETKERVKSSSSKKKERLTGTGKGTSEPKKSRNKSSAAAKGRVAAWLGGIDPAVPPQEEIIPPSPSVVRDLDRLSFEDEQTAAIGSLARSPLAAAPLLPLHPDSDSPTTPGGALAFNARSDVAANGLDNEINMDQDKVISASPNPRSSGFVSIATLKRNTISLPSAGSVIRRPLLLSRDATVIEEARRVQELWSSTPPGITPLDKDTLKPGGATGAMSLLPHEKVTRKPSPSSSFSKPANVIPLSYSAAVTSVPPSAPASSSSATITPRSVWKNVDQTQSTSQPKGRQVPPSTTKPTGYNPPSGNLPPMFPPSKPPINPEVKYDIRSARGGRGGKVSSVASLWASGAINNQRHNHQTAATTAAAAASHSDVKGKMKEVPKPLFNAVEEGSDTLPSSSSALSKPVTTKKKLFSAAVMTPSPALKNVRTYSSPTVASGSGGVDSSGPKKMASTSALPVRSVDVLGEKAAASRSIDNLLAERKTPTATTTTMMNVLQGGKPTPSANLSTSSSGPPGGKLHELTTTKRAAVNGPPGVMIKATSDPAVISSSHAVPTLSSTASLVRPHGQNSTGQKQDYYRHLQPRVAVVKLPSTTPSSGVGARSSSTVSPQLGSPQVAVVDNNTNNDPKKPAELAFGQARLRDLIKKYQGSSPAAADGGQKT